MGRIKENKLIFQQVISFLNRPVVRKNHLEYRPVLLAKYLDIIDGTSSEYLRWLFLMGFLHKRKDGNRAFYSVNNEQWNKERAIEAFQKHYHNYSWPSGVSGC